MLNSFRIMIILLAHLWGAILAMGSFLSIEKRL